MNSQASKKVTLALGVATVASQFGTLAASAGPALQTLTNMTNGAEFTINNTYGQSFSIQGAVSASGGRFQVFGFLTGTNAVNSKFVNNGAILQTGFIGSLGVLSGAGSANVLRNGLRAVTAVTAFVRGLTANGFGGRGMALFTGAGGLQTVKLIAQTGTQTIGASISTTLFGPSNIKATASFTSQLINDLSAF